MHMVMSTCMLLAAKYDEIHPAPIDDFIYLYKQIDQKEFKREKISYTVIKTIERHIVQTIDFNFSKPHSFAFLRFYAMVLDYGKWAHQFTKMLLDLVLLNNKTCHFAPSIAAVMAITLAQKFVSDPFFDTQKYYNERITYWKPNTQTYHTKTWLEALTMMSGYPTSALQPGIIEIAKFLVKVLSANTKNHTKYKDFFHKFDFMKELKNKFATVSNEIISKNDCHIKLKETRTSARIEMNLKEQQKSSGELKDFSMG